MARANSQILLGKFNEARMSLELAQQLDTLKIMVFESNRLKGYCELNLNDYYAATQSYEKAKGHDSNRCDSTFYNEFSKVLLMLKDTTESIKIIEKLLSFNANAPNSLYLKACYFVLKNMDTEAIEWFKKSFESKILTTSFVKKDRVLTAIRPSFRDNKDFKQLVKNSTD